VVELEREGDGGSGIERDRVGRGVSVALVSTQPWAAFENVRQAMGL
jgi:hypothetical protein